MTVDLSLPRPTPSLNQWQRMHWATRRREQRDWTAMVLCAAPDAPIASWRCVVTVTRVGTRLLDADNLVGGAKVLVDALKARRLIVDDSPRWVTLHVEQRRTEKGERPHTRIQVDEMVGDINDDAYLGHDGGGARLFDSPGTWMVRLPATYRRGGFPVSVPDGIVFARPLCYGATCRPDLCCSVSLVDGRLLAYREKAVTCGHVNVEGWMLPATYGHTIVEECEDTVDLSSITVEGHLPRPGRMQ